MVILFIKRKKIQFFVIMTFQKILKSTEEKKRFRDVMFFTLYLWYYASTRSPVIKEATCIVYSHGTFFPLRREVPSFAAFVNNNIMEKKRNKSHTARDKR